MKEIKAYKCEHCAKKILFSVKGIERHELHCVKNPANYFPCLDCAHCSSNSSYGGLFCHEKKVGVHNIGAVQRGYVEKYPDDYEDSEIVTKCDLFKPYLKTNNVC